MSALGKTVLAIAALHTWSPRKPKQAELSRRQHSRPPRSSHHLRVHRPEKNLMEKRIFKSAAVVPDWPSMTAISLSSSDVSQHESFKAFLTILTSRLVRISKPLLLSFPLCPFLPFPKNYTHTAVQHFIVFSRIMLCPKTKTLRVFVYNKLNLVISCPKRNETRIDRKMIIMYTIVFHVS